MKLYIASSWRNQRYPSVVADLKEHFDCYDFRNPKEGDNGFSWRQITDTPPNEWTPEFYRDVVLKSERAREGFISDMEALSGADACVMVLPCGRSAHLELGWAAGAGKPTIVLLDTTIDEPELMYLMNTSICTSVEETIATLKLLDKPVVRMVQTLHANLMAGRTLGGIFDGFFADFATRRGAELGKQITEKRRNAKPCQCGLRDFTGAVITRDKCPAHRDTERPSNGRTTYRVEIVGESADTAQTIEASSAGEAAEGVAASYFEYVGRETGVFPIRVIVYTGTEGDAVRASAPFTVRLDPSQTAVRFEATLGHHSTG